MEFYTPAAEYIKVHFRLNFIMEANTMNPTKTDLVFVCLFLFFFVCLFVRTYQADEKADEKSYNWWGIGCVM